MGFWGVKLAAPSVGITAPSYVGTSKTNYTNSNSGVAKTASVTTQVGDVLVVCGVGEAETEVLGTPTGGSLTYTLQQSVVVSAYCSCYMWTAIANANTTFSVSITMTRSGGGSAFWGFGVEQWRGSTGVGNSAKANVSGAAPSLSLTPQQANSAMVCLVGDWNAADGTSRTWRTVNGITPTSGNGGEHNYFRDASHYTNYGGHWMDVGSVAAKTLGLSAPSGQKYSIVGVEVKGT